MEGNNHNNNNNTMEEGFISGNRCYTNSSGGNVDENIWLAGKQQITSSTSQDGTEVVTTSRQHFVRRQTKTTITDVSFDSFVNHYPTFDPRHMANGEDNKWSLSNDYPPHQQETHPYPSMPEFEERQPRIALLPDSEYNRRNDRTFLLRPTNHHRHQLSLDGGQIGSKEICLKNSSFYSNNEPLPPPSVDTFSSPMATGGAFDSMVARQRAEFIRMFPQFKHIKLAEPEIIVRNIEQPDGTILTVETKIMRRQVEFR